MESRTALALVFLVCLCFSDSLSKKMKRQIWKREDVLEMLMQQRDALQIEKRASQVILKDNCNFPELTNIVIENNNKVVPMIWDQPFCQLRPFPVRIDVPSHYVIYPTYVMLYRCIGGEYSRLEQCVASRKEKITVKYTDLLTFQERGAIMYNHTACTKECIVKQEECNPNESFRNCICDCNINANHCNSTWQSFNSHKCSCECKIVHQCDLYKEWNATTCQCECAKCIRDMCAKKKLQLDTDQCRCSLTQLDWPSFSSSKTSTHKTD